MFNDSFCLNCDCCGHCENIERYNRIFETIISKKYPKDEKLPKRTKKTSKLEEISGAIQECAKKGELPILYRYSPADINNLENIESGSVFLMPIFGLNDVMEGVVENCHMEQVDKWQKHIYIKCFSVCPFHPLMWGHYADNYKGMCVGYDFNKIVNSNSEVVEHLFPIQYLDIRFSSIKPDEIQEHKFFFLRKGPSWSYEREWRLIYSKDEITKKDKKGEKGEVKQLLPLNCISEIYFGTRTREIVKKFVKNIVKSQGLDIKLVETEVAPTGYKIIGPKPQEQPQTILQVI